MTVVSTTKNRVLPGSLDHVYLLLLASSLPFLTTSCVKMPNDPPVHLTSTVLPATIHSLPPAPPLLTQDEQQTSWGQEYRLGQRFASDGDYYRASTCFYRSRFLLDNPNSPHAAQLLHALLVTYALGGKYQEAIDAWERDQATIQISDPDLARDCISLLFEAYVHTNHEDKASQLLTILPADDQLRTRLPLFERICTNSDDSLSSAPPIAALIGTTEHEEAKALAATYALSRKAPKTARILNAVLPGAGYLYVHQYQTAFTSFAINALFIGATWQLISAHQLAAGIIAGGFEGGWYLGGIAGAGLSADIYNQRLREQLGKPYLESHHLFPLNQLHYGW